MAREQKINSDSIIHFEIHFFKWASYVANKKEDESNQCEYSNMSDTTFNTIDIELKTNEIRFNISFICNIYYLLIMLNSELLMNSMEYTLQRAKINKKNPTYIGSLLMRYTNSLQFFFFLFQVFCLIEFYQHLDSTRVMNLTEDESLVCIYFCNVLVFSILMGLRKSFK